jgi:hypothetical protein
VAAELLAWAVARAGGDQAMEFQRMSERFEPGVAETLGRIASRPARELEPGMWRAVETAAGPILVDDEFERVEPTVDLVGIALGVREVLEADVYRVSDLTVATELPQVWLTPTDRAALERALGATRACVSVRAQPYAATTSTGRDQQLLVFLGGRERGRRAVDRSHGCTDKVTPSSRLGQRPALLRSCRERVRCRRTVARTRGRPHRAA